MALLTAFGRSAHADIIALYFFEGDFFLSYQEMLDLLVDIVRGRVGLG
jgi:hypothetical protein